MLKGVRLEGVAKFGYERGPLYFSKLGFLAISHIKNTLGSKRYLQICSVQHLNAVFHVEDPGSPTFPFKELA